MNRYGLNVHINDPELRQGVLLTTEFLVGDLPLRPGEFMEYLYDFGDRWKFKVELEKIEPDEPEIKEPAVVESAGESPEQYEYWE
ncbi:MAG: plasmid pRiA4b ORF-3 family protein [Desulfobacteraceae bacterium]|nr:plasmid pRiA4b ORF-3 family protein [Desulfobacteraceae bacterium]